MTIRLFTLFALMSAAPVALAAGPGSTPDWASPAVPATPPDNNMGPGVPPNPPTAPPAVPVDGGLTLLALAGAGYATKKLRARNAA